KQASVLKVLIRLDFGVVNLISLNSVTLMTRTFLPWLGYSKNKPQKVAASYSCSALQIKE
ncbi:22594_t:CDS:1, partial [Gigaspora margarita]